MTNNAVSLSTKGKQMIGWEEIMGRKVLKKKILWTSVEYNLNDLYSLGFFNYYGLLRLVWDAEGVGKWACSTMFNYHERSEVLGFTEWVEGMRGNKRYIFYLWIQRVYRIGREMLRKRGWTMVSPGSQYGGMFRRDGYLLLYTGSTLMLGLDYAYHSRIIHKGVFYVYDTTHWAYGGVKYINDVSDAFNTIDKITRVSSRDIVSPMECYSIVELDSRLSFSSKCIPIGVLPLIKKRRISISIGGSRYSYGLHFIRAILIGKMGRKVERFMKLDGYDNLDLYLKEVYGYDERMEVGEGDISLMFKKAEERYATFTRAVSVGMKKMHKEKRKELG